MLCGKKLKIFSVLLVQFFLLFCSPFCFSCYAEVVLTEEEAQQIQNELSQSKKDLQKAKEEIAILKENVQKEAQEQKNELLTVKDTYKEQTVSYEEQLKEAEKKNDTLETAVTITTTTSVGLLITLLVIIFI